MNRPALQQILADVEASKVDVIVLYKVAYSRKAVGWATDDHLPVRSSLSPPWRWP
jgi:hypothetical protein